MTPIRITKFSATRVENFIPRGESRLEFIRQRLSGEHLRGSIRDIGFSRDLDRHDSASLLSG